MSFDDIRTGGVSRKFPGMQAEHSVRVDRLAERVERIESRLDLRE